MKKKLNIVYLSIVLTNVLIAILNYSKFKKWFSLFFPILLMLIFILQYAVSKNKLNVCRSEERLSRNAETDLVCRLLLEKKNNLIVFYSYFI